MAKTNEAGKSAKGNKGAEGAEKIEGAAPAEKPAKRVDTRLSGFYSRDPWELCIIGRDTKHTGRGIDASKGHHVNYDTRGLGKPSDEGVEKMLTVEFDVDPVPFRREKMPASMLTDEFRKHNALPTDGEVTVDVLTDGRHRAIDAREANVILTRSGKEPGKLPATLKTWDDLESLDQQIAHNGYNELPTLEKAYLFRDRVRIAAELATKRGESVDEKMEKSIRTETCMLLGIHDRTARLWGDLLSRHPEVLAAVELGVEHGGINSTTAIEAFRKVAFDDQPAVLAKILKGGAKSTDDARMVAKGPETTGEGDDGEGDDGDGEGGEEKPVSGGSTETKTSKPAKKVLRKLVDAAKDSESKVKLPAAFVAALEFKLTGKFSEKITGNAHDAVEEFAKGIRFCDGDSVKVSGLTGAMRELKLTAE